MIISILVSVMVLLIGLLTYTFCIAVRDSYNIIEDCRNIIAECEKETVQETTSRFLKEMEPYSKDNTCH